MSTSQEALKGTVGALVREQTYVLMMTPHPDAPPVEFPERLRMEHHHYLVTLEREGILFAAGPFADRGEKPSGSGMIIIRAENRAQAEEIGAREPFTRAKIRIMQVLPWQRNEGSLRIELRLADGVLKLDGRTYVVAKPSSE